MTKLAVIGAGSWGTALAIGLAPRFEQVALWARDPCRVEAIHRSRENAIYLPGCLLPGSVAVATDAQRVVADASIVLLAVPSQAMRAICQRFRGLLPRGTPIVSATKGLENGTLLRMSEVIRAETGGSEVAILSGPTFAREVAAGQPAAMVLAAAQLGLAQSLQQAFASDALRFYASDDAVGVEIGAALKNVVAIGAGICAGLELGSNALAALVTRGLAEITRLAVAMGGRVQTLTGLAGLGDLVLTCTGVLSRNRTVGVRLGRGETLPQILASMPAVAEGVPSCRAAYQLAQSYAVAAPIVDEMYAILHQGKDPRLALTHLMRRPLTVE